MLTLIIGLLFAPHSQCAKILGIFNIPSISHQVVYQPIWKELSLRGHQVTVLTPNPLNNASLTNLTEIDMSSVYDMLRDDYIGDRLSKDLYAIQVILWFLDKMGAITEEFFKRVLLLDPNTHFDLVIVETYHPLVYSLGSRFRVPFIGISSSGLLLQTHDAVGNPTHPILSPNIVTNLKNDFTLYEKINNFLYNFWYRILFYWYILPNNYGTAKKYWGDIIDLERNVSLILVNSNPVLSFVRPQVPNVVEMVQMHIKTPKPLPQDIQTYLDTSTQGVVYLSLGSNVRSSKLCNKTRKIIINTLSQLPYNVLWKWETDDFSDFPKNVLARKWFPQQDILRHENVKVFVTQGGFQSLEETIVSGVPIVGLPFISDQPMNVMKVVKTGLGRGLNYVTMTTDELRDAIIDVAENEKYRRKAAKLKYLFSDQAVTGLEKSIWWIEYILRHNGARYLRNEAIDMSWFEYFLLDVVAVFLFSFVIFGYFVILCWNLCVKGRVITNKMKAN